MDTRSGQMPIMSPQLSQLNPATRLSALVLLSVAAVGLGARTATANDKTIGPLKVCVYVTVNDSTPTENVKVSATGAAGDRGAFVLKGTAANVTTHFKVRKNGTAFTSFNGTTSGSQRITVTLGWRTRVINLTIPSGTNVRQQAGCTPH
jgi:hypothetical protein